MKKKILSAVCALVLVFGSAAALPQGFAKLDSAITASAETYGDYEYSVLDDGTVEISKYNGSDEEVNIPSTIDGKKVTSIGGSAFYDCTSLTSVTIPDSVTSIGAYAFSGTVWLKNLKEKDPLVIVNKMVIDGESCKDNVVIPEGVTSICDCAFRWCAIKSITIPNSITSIGEQAFSGCEDLTSIIIPNSVTSIGEEAFLGCTNLKEIKIPNGVTTIENQMFYECECLTDVIIPNSVTSIGEEAFLSCKSLTRITIPNSVTRIGDSAFEDCASLTSITIPDSVTEIGDWAFGYYYDNRGYTVKIEGFTIYGYKGTAAETYATENEFKFVALGGDTRKKGDLNGNGKIDASDLLQVKSHIKKVKTLTGDEFAAADVDGNGVINASDLLKMKAHMKGVTLLWK